MEASAHKLFPPTQFFQSIPLRANYHQHLCKVPLKKVVCLLAKSVRHPVDEKVRDRSRSLASAGPPRPAAAARTGSPQHVTYQNELLYALCQVSIVLLQLLVFREYLLVYIEI